MTFTFRLIALSVFLLPSFSNAARWQINPDHSEILFEIPYLHISEITGRFKEFQGEVLFPKEGISPSEISITVMTPSIDSGNRQRDGHLKSHDFLRAQTHPKITFFSQTITPLASDNYRAQGILNVAGVAKPFQIEFTMTKAVRDTWNFESRFVKFSSQFNRRDFGITWNKTLPDNKYLVGDMISIRGTFQLQPALSQTPAVKHLIPDTAYIRKREKMNRGEVPLSQVGILPTPRVMDTPPRELNKITEALSEDKKEVEFRYAWWAALATLGLYGFLGSIFFSIYAKKFVSEKYPESYSESSFLGLLTDAISVLIIFIFALAFWELGWG